MQQCWKDLVIANRSYQGMMETYKMSQKELLELVDCARLSPCSVNAQPFKYFPGLGGGDRPYNSIFDKMGSGSSDLQIPP